MPCPRVPAEGSLARPQLAAHGPRDRAVHAAQPAHLEVYLERDVDGWKSLSKASWKVGSLYGRLDVY